MAVIRYGQKPQRMRGTSDDDVRTLSQFWELEEQLGVRQKPEDNLLSIIPVVTVRPQQQHNQTPADNENKEI